MEKTKNSNLAKRTLMGVVMFLVSILVLVMLPSWSITFWPGWIYFGVFVISISFISAYFLKKDPELMERRLTAGPGAEKEGAQKTIQSFASLFLILMLLIPGLDYHFHWSFLSFGLVVTANFLVLMGFVIIFFVFKENSYTSGIIEVGRGQKIISTGPYSLVRHPMYAGATLLFISSSIALGSWFGLPFAILLIATMIIRALDEEKFLKKNLTGYSEYCHKVHYRLIPFIW